MLQHVHVEPRDGHQSLAREIFPEVFTYTEHIDIPSWRKRMLQELEKGLRWMRLLFAKVVRLSDNLIHQVRQEHLESQPLEEIIDAPRESGTPSVHVESQSVPANSLEALRIQEQKLILAIAQNPRDTQLYKEIGDVYGKLKSYSDAKEAFAKVLKLDPKDTTAQEKLLVLQEFPSDESQKQ